MPTAPHDPPLVLVADDEPDLLELTMRRLRRAGFDVIAAVDGVQAWDLVRDRCPRVAVLDVRMPGCDGVELARRIRAEAALAGTRVVLHTASVRRHEEAGARAAGADAFLRKPCSAEELVAAVRSAMEQSITP